MGAEPQFDADGLLPCPFCGGEADNRHEHIVECRNCVGVSVYACAESREKAIAAWNKRPSPTAPPSPSQARGRVAGDEIRRWLATLIKYGQWQIDEGADHHPTLPSALAAAKNALNNPPGSPSPAPNAVAVTDEMVEPAAMVLYAAEPIWASDVPEIVAEDTAAAGAPRELSWDEACVRCPESVNEFRTLACAALEAALSGGAP